jgi:predicted tellurium resistance membrane protein TerC
VGRQQQQQQQYRALMQQGMARLWGLLLVVVLRGGCCCLQRRMHISYGSLAGGQVVLCWCCFAFLLCKLCTHQDLCYSKPAAVGTGRV